MSYNLSVCVFIKDTFKGAFCLFESMATLLPLASEFLVMDLGSTDGTLEVLQSITEVNPKVKLLNGSFYKIDANVFATLANDLIAECQYDKVLYYQADEIWHEDLVELVRQKLDEGKNDLTFWRIQYRENFQKVKWYPHVVHRIGHKDNFNFVGDGMNTDKHFEPEMCSNWDKEWFIKWGSDYENNPTALPTNEMILDVSMVGAFLENIPERRSMHAPFWHEEPHVEGKLASEWMKVERQNTNWNRDYTDFDIPEIMKYHLGNPRYVLRDDLLQALKEDRSYIKELQGWK